MADNTSLSTKQDVSEEENQKPEFVTSRLRYARISPRKVQIVCDLIRGEYADKALAILDATPKAASPLISKVLKSAIGNAVNSYDMDRRSLVVAVCKADPGPILKRGQPRAQGRMFRINKRTSHITIMLAEDSSIAKASGKKSGKSGGAK